MKAKHLSVSPRPPDSMYPACRAVVKTYTEQQLDSISPCLRKSPPVPPQTPRDAEQLGWPVRFSSDAAEALPGGQPPPPPQQQQQQQELRRQSLWLGPQAQARVIAAGVRKAVEVRVWDNGSGLLARAGADCAAAGSDSRRSLLCPSAMPRSGRQLRPALRPEQSALHSRPQHGRPANACPLCCRPGGNSCGAALLMRASFPVLLQESTTSDGPLPEKASLEVLLNRAAAMKVWALALCFSQRTLPSLFTDDSGLAPVSNLHRAETRRCAPGFYFSPDLCSRLPMRPYAVVTRRVFFPAFSATFMPPHGSSAWRCSDAQSTACRAPECNC